MSKIRTDKQLNRKVIKRPSGVNKRHGKLAVGYTPKQTKDMKDLDVLGMYNYSHYRS